MKKMSELGYKVCVWPETTKEKDINDMWLAGMNSTVKDVIDENTRQGLELSLAINNWSKV